MITINKDNIDNIIERLLESIPEISELYYNEIISWDGVFPGLHNIFGDVVIPYIENILEEDNDKEFLKRVFDFFEIIATCKDEYIENVLEVTVLESIGDSKKRLQTAKKYMGKHTIELSDSIERYLGRKQ